MEAQQPTVALDIPKARVKLVLLLLFRPFQAAVFVLRHSFFYPDLLSTQFNFLTI